jgi:HEPN domain-containing protein
MISVQELKKISKARLKDAEALYSARRYDGAVYLCGYAIETALKVRICTNLEWTEFPQTSGEFRNYQSFKTHDLDILLRLTGIENKIRRSHLTEWSVVSNWDSESRYNPIGNVTQTDALSMINSTKTLLQRVL